MLYPAARRHPLHVAIAISASRPHRIGMIYQALPHHRYGFKTPMRMTWKSGHLFSMIHPISIFYDKIIS